MSSSIFHQFVDMPGSMYTRVVDIDNALRTYRAYYDGLLPQAFLLPPNLGISAPLIDESNPDCKGDVHVSVSPHRRPLLFVKQGDDLKRLTELTDVVSSLRPQEDDGSDYGSDGMDWDNPIYIAAMDEAQKIEREA